jgi:hypothetical protein
MITHKGKSPNRQVGDPSVSAYNRRVVRGANTSTGQVGDLSVSTCEDPWPCATRLQSETEKSPTFRLGIPGVVVRSCL